jgi:GNAT superfamily N-acetyltransferase
MAMPDETLADGTLADGTLVDAVARRWEAMDPLLPRPSAATPGCGAELVAAGGDGRLAAVAACEHSAGVPGSMDLTWSAARAFRLTALIADEDVDEDLGALLSRWSDHLDRVPGTDGEDTSAVVTWPSRDVEGVAALLRHGLAPLIVVAVRRMGRRGQPQVPDQAGPRWRGGADVRIRRAGPADIDAVTRLGLETIRFDAYFGAVNERPYTGEALRAEAVTALAGPEPWVWLAERRGAPVGMAWAERPEAAGWIAPMTAASPVAYLYLMGVAAAERGGGIGTALAARAHQEIEAAGVAATLLHYALPSPLSAPFWAMQGYRPLWTGWEARPASTLR